MSRIAVGAALLASAFAPLVALVAVVRLPDLGAWTWAVVGCCALAVGFLLLVLRGVRQVQSRTVQTRTVRRADDKVLAFTSGHLVPVVVAAFGGGSAASLAGAVGLVAVLALVYVRGRLFQLNPTLAMLGYRLFELTADNGTVTMLLTHARRLPQEGLVRCHYLGDDVAVQFREDA